MSKSAFLLIAATFCVATMLLSHYRSAAPSRPAAESGQTNAARPADAASPNETARKQAGTPSPPKSPAVYRSVRIDGVPHVKQKPDFCGEACAAMVLAKLGYRMDQDDVFDQSGLDPELGRGCFTRELARALTQIGFRIGPVWYRAEASRAADEMEAHFRALHADLAAGIPVIVCMHYDDQPDTTEHFRLVLGYDAQTDEVLVHEPAEADGAYTRMARQQFLKLWPLKYDRERWSVIRFRLSPGTIRDVHSTAKFTAADYAQRVLQLKQQTPEGFTIVVQKPYVVIGDESPAEVRRRATGTIQWAYERLKREYFPQDPDDILDIWLFKDAESYTQHTTEIFGEVPHTPFGYFDHEHKALIMNIDTGGGTLVHEMVHPFLAANFPDCPAWFNEGLASLYEQCGDRRGRIWGYTNWRLEGLQKAIKPEQEPPDDVGSEATPAEERQELPTFKTLCSTTTYEFYGADPGTNYAQARYLCYYLQQRGLLNKYYHQFRRNVRQDPTGYETLKAVLGIDDEAGMAKFQETWKAWVLELRFP